MTGGAGFIGSHIVEALVDDGDEVLVVDDLSSGGLQNLERPLAAGSEFLQLDVRDAPEIEQAFHRFRPDVVFHLAAQMDVRASMVDPAHDASINITGSINVFAAADAVGARRVINTSTGGAIYGDGVTTPTPETARTNPAAAYGLSKQSAELYANWFRRARSLDIVTLRYGNVYGPRQDPDGDSGVIAIFCGLVLDGGQPTVYGDGLQTRDYVFVRDIVEANLAAVRMPTLSHTEYNIGTGTEVSVLQLAEAVAAAAGVKSSDFMPIFMPARQGELARSCLDVSRARAELRTAAPTPLVDGLSVTVDWVRAAGGVRDAPPRLR